MSKLEELKEKFDEAETALSDAQDEMHNYLAPIIKAHAGVDKLYGIYHSMWTYDEEAHITLRSDRSGGPYDYDYTIPLSVFELADEAAVEAARKAREEREQKKRDGRRAQDEAAFEALRVKLGK